MHSFHIYAKDDELSLSLRLRIDTALRRAQWVENAISPELVVVIGGDGAMLRTIHQYIQHLDTVAFVGVHTGTLGFYTDYESTEVDELIEVLLTQTPWIEEQSLVEADFDDAAEPSIIALNEIRFENPMRTMVVDVEIDGQLLERFKGNGLNISTPSGSTAYNKSLGGAVVLPPLTALQLTEIAPIRHNKYSSLQSPLILAGNHKITLDIQEWQGTVIGYDHLTCSMKNAHRIHIHLSKKSVRFARYRHYPFIKRLQKAFIFNQ